MRDFEIYSGQGRARDVARGVTGVGTTPPLLNKRDAQCDSTSEYCNWTMAPRFEASRYVYCQG